MKKMTARDVMNPHVIAIRADRTVQEAAVFLVEQAISGALVTDREDTPIGVVSMTDIVEMRSEESSSLPDVPEYYSRSWEYQLSREDMDELHIENPGRLVKDIIFRDRKRAHLFPMSRSTTLEAGSINSPARTWTSFTLRIPEDSSRTL